VYVIPPRRVRHLPRIEKMPHHGEKSLKFGGGLSKMNECSFIA
jgi:hypothetical protein